MRVRKKKNGDARFDACKELFIEFDKETPEKLSLAELFPGFTKFRAEIGCGKGTFITETAKRNPDVAFLAVEKVRDVVIFASEKVQAENLPNVRFICGDAAALTALLDEKSLETIYINFCDPWPKARHAKRRLTSEGFLRLFKNLLADDGKIEFKTDNIGLFEFSLEEFPKAGYEMRDVCFDLHASEWAENNVQTEYERNFSAKGFKINRLEAFKAEK
ncbi:MAG: tRNA (guanosine(46)-N7)-methyltransferase TrmB [Clostridia bacterium]|nr:tRNA (guanosine(46)-N7)-methyltransferase TrmB [Clostridia bacterium]